MASSEDRPITSLVGVFQQSLSVEGDDHKVALNRHHERRRTANLVANKDSRLVRFPEKWEFKTSSI
jgi:hypothetical protein